MLGVSFAVAYVQLQQLQVKGASKGRNIELPLGVSFIVPVCVGQYYRQYIGHSHYWVWYRYWY